MPTSSTKTQETYQPVRVEVIGPQYYKWVYGEEQSPHHINASASDRARLVVNRLTPAETTLRGSSTAAERAIEMVSLY